MDDKTKAIKKNGTWELVELPKRGKKIGVKWFYKNKFKKKGKWTNTRPSL